MGCLPGNIVEVLQIAPLSDPIYIKVNDSFLSIRKDLKEGKLLSDIEGLNTETFNLLSEYRKRVPNYNG